MSPTELKAKIAAVLEMNDRRALMSAMPVLLAALFEAIQTANAETIKIVFGYNDTDNSQAFLGKLQQYLCGLTSRQQKEFINSLRKAFSEGLKITEVLPSTETVSEPKLIVLIESFMQDSCTNSSLLTPAIFLVLANIEIIYKNFDKDNWLSSLIDIIIVNTIGPVTTGISLGKNLATVFKQIFALNIFQLLNLLTKHKKLKSFTVALNEVIRLNLLLDVFIEIKAADELTELHAELLNRGVKFSDNTLELFLRSADKFVNSERLFSWLIEKNIRKLNVINPYETVRSLAELLLEALNTSEEQYNRIVLLLSHFNNVWLLAYYFFISMLIRQVDGIQRLHALYQKLKPEDFSSDYLLAVILDKVLFDQDKFIRDLYQLLNYQCNYELDKKLPTLLIDILDANTLMEKLLTADCFKIAYCFALIILMHNPNNNEFIRLLKSLHGRIKASFINEYYVERDDEATIQEIIYQILDSSLDTLELDRPVNLPAQKIFNLFFIFNEEEFFINKDIRYNFILLKILLALTNNEISEANKLEYCKTILIRLYNRNANACALRNFNETHHVFLLQAGLLRLTKKMSKEIHLSNAQIAAGIIIRLWNSKNTRDKEIVEQIIQDFFKEKLMNILDESLLQQIRTIRKSLFEKSYTGVFSYASSLAQNVGLFRRRNSSSTEPATSTTALSRSISLTELPDSRTVGSDIKTTSASESSVSRHSLSSTSLG